MSDPVKPKNDELVEMEAMDLEEWERDRHTPQQTGEKQADLVKQTAAAPPPTPPSLPRKTQTIARTVTRNATPSAGTPALGRTQTPVAGVPRAQTPVAGIPSVIRTQTPAGGAPTAKIPSSAVTPAGGVPAPAGGAPIARITPTKQTPSTGTPVVTRNTVRTPAVGVGVRSTGAQPPVAAKTRTPAAGLKLKHADGIDPDTEGWSLPDDDLSVPVEQAKVIAPKPRLDAMQADTWSLPDSVIEETPLPPTRAKTEPPVAQPAPNALKTLLGTGPAVEDQSSMFAATTSVGTAALDDDLPIAIAPFEPPVLDVTPAVVEPEPAPVPVVAPSPATFPAPPSAAAAKPEVFEADESMSAREQRSVKTDMFPAARPASKKPLFALLGLAAVIAVVVLVFALRSKSPADDPRPPTQVAVADPTPTDAAAVVAPDGNDAPPDPVPPDPVPTNPTPTNVTPTNPTADPLPTTRPIGTRPARGKGRGKGAVATATPEPPVAPTGDASDAKADAKTSYNAGNKSLYAADAAGAIREFQAALAAAPNFVAAQRGLGLAYSLQGDKARAIAAFKAYLAGAPGAKDTAKIQERITALQAK